MATLKDVRNRAKVLGAIVSDIKEFNVHECRVTAPQGFCWEEQLHEFVDCANQPWKPDYDDLLNRMKNGCYPCTYPECDWCNTEYEE